jgi:hypothetical protein
MADLIPLETIAAKIYTFRGKKVLLDKDLAQMYGVETKRLNEQVVRNKKRFPEDFMFQLKKEEADFLRSQNATLKNQYRHLKYLPCVFTQEGVAMLSSVLNSERAIAVNIQIMRAFVSLRRIGLTYTGLKRKIEDMEKEYDKQFSMVFEAIKQLLEPAPVKEKPPIGFHR